MSMNDFKRKLLGPVVWGNLLAMALLGVAVFVGLLVWMGSYTMHGEGVDVPDVKGMMLSDARYSLGQLDLVTVVVDSAYVREQPAGIVLEQKPGFGSRVKSGREIYLTVNQKLTPTNTIPDIAGNCSRREAEARLRSLGFKIGPIELVPGDPDWVIGLKVNGREVYAGDRVPCDVPVVLVVGNNSRDFDGDDSGDGVNPWSDAAVDEDDIVEYEEEL